MQAVIVILLLLGSFSALLKLGFMPNRWRGVWAIVLAIATGLSWSIAAAQSKTQIADFLSAPALMADAAVLIFVEVALMIAFCIVEISGRSLGRSSRTRRVLHWLLGVFPGCIVFVATFSLLTWSIFHLPRVSFPLISWGLGALLLLAIPLLSWGLKRLVPEAHLRLELLFILNVLIGCLSIVATVNGRTSVEGATAVQWSSLLGVLVAVVAMVAAGVLLRTLKVNKKNK